MAARLAPRGGQFAVPGTRGYFPGFARWDHQTRWDGGADVAAVLQIW